jgi:hypothetical protein
MTNRRHVPRQDAGNHSFSTEWARSMMARPGVALSSQPRHAAHQRPCRAARAFEDFTVVFFAALTLHVCPDDLDLI